MNELREDYVLDRWVIIAEKRGKRPHDIISSQPKAKPKAGKCFFCPGNEKLTPDEIGRISRGKDWIIRWFPNKFAAVSRKGIPQIRKKGIYTHSDAFGSAEVIVETPEHTKELHDLSTLHISKILKVYSNRITELSKVKGIKYVNVFKNHGAKAGTSLVHSHSQVIATNRRPTLIKKKARLSMMGGKCRYCEVIRKEAKTKRLIQKTKRFISIAPYASRFNYEAWIFPLRHLKSITDFSEDDFIECAGHIKRIITRLSKMDASYNMFLHYAPKGSDMHFHIEITPRIADFAGFEISTDTIINSVSPESAAAFYRK